MHCTYGRCTGCMDCKWHRIGMAVALRNSFLHSMTVPPAGRTKLHEDRRQQLQQIASSVGVGYNVHP